MLRIATLMKTSILSFSVCFVIVAGFLTACHRKPDTGKVVLGPMLSKAVLPDPLSRQTASEMRTWVQNFKRSDLERLNGIRRIVFSWEELQTAYPEQARMIEKANGECWVVI